MFAGCQIPYPKREFLTEEEPEDKADKVRNVRSSFPLETLVRGLYTASTPHATDGTGML